MSPPTPINMEKLLAPIREDKPAGDDVQYTLYGDINQARTSKYDRDAERQIPPDWRRVLQLTVDGLLRQSKDIQLCCWLTESLSHLHGFAGLQQGLEVTLAVMDRYWDGLYPQDPEVRGARFDTLTLSDKGPPIVRMTPIAQQPDDGPEITFDYCQNEANQSHVDAAIALTPPDFFSDLAEQIRLCLEAIEAIKRFLDEKLGQDAPNWSDLSTTIQRIQSTVARILADKVSAGPGSPELPVGSDVVGSGPSAAPGGRQSRAAVIADIRKSAKELRAIDKHSPVPQLLELAAEWADEPWEEISRILIRNDRLQDLLGLAAG